MFHPGCWPLRQYSSEIDSVSEVLARWVLTAQLDVTNRDEILTVETALHVLTPQFIDFFN